MTAAAASVTDGAECAVFDLCNDSIYRSRIENGAFQIDLCPYQSVIAVFDKDREALSGIKEKNGLIPCETADLTFRIETAPYDRMSTYDLFKDGVKAADLPGTAVTPGFSGKIKYTCRFDKPIGVCGIDLGRVGQISRLYCNGKDCGIRLCPPYGYDLSDKLTEGENEIVIEVSNTLANAVRDPFSAFLPIPRSGLCSAPLWLRSDK